MGVLWVNQVPMGSIFEILCEMHNLDEPHEVAKKPSLAEAN